MNLFQFLLCSQILLSFFFYQHFLFAICHYPNFILICCQLLLFMRFFLYFPFVSSVFFVHVQECVRVLCSFNHGNCNSKYHNLRIVFCGLQFAKLTYERWPKKSFKLTYSVSVEHYLKPLARF